MSSRGCFAGALLVFAACAAPSATTSPANDAKVVVAAAAPAPADDDAGVPREAASAPEDNDAWMPSVAPRAEPVDRAQPANPGQSLGDGTYVFSDGLRIEYRYKKECDFDVSVPCVWSHEVTASFEQVEKHLSLTRNKPKAIAVGHTFEVVKDRLVVRK